MGPKTVGVRHRSVTMGMEVADEALIGDDVGFLQTIHPLPDFDINIAARVGKGEEGLSKEDLVWGVLQVYLRVLLVRHRVVQVIIDDFSRQVMGTFLGVGDDGVEVDLAVKEADFWVSGVAVVG